MISCEGCMIREMIKLISHISESFYIMVIVYNVSQYILKVKKWYCICISFFKSCLYSQLILSPSAQIKNMCGETTDSQDLFLFNCIVVFQSSSEGLGTIERLSRAMAGLQLTDSDSEHLAAFIANKYLQSIYFITYKNMTKCKMASSVSWKRKQETRTIPLPSWCHHQIHQCVNSKRMYVSV